MSLCGIFPLYGWKAVSMDFQDKIGIFATIAEDNDVIVWTVDRKFTAADFIKQGYTPISFRVKNLGDESVCISSTSLISDHSFNISRWVTQITYDELWRPLTWCMLRGVPLLAIASAATVQAMYEDINKKVAQAQGNAYFSSKETYESIAVYGWALTVLNLILLTPYHWLRIKELNMRMNDAVEDIFCLSPIIISPLKEVNKVYLVPHVPAAPVEFAVFHEKTDAVAAQFYIDYSNT